MADNEKLNIDIQSKFDISNVEKNVKKITEDMKQFGKSTKPVFGEIEKQINAVNKALQKASSEGHIKQLNIELKKLHDEQKRLSEIGLKVNETNKSMTGTFTQMRASMLLVAAAAAGSVYAMTNMVKQAAAFNEVRSTFKGSEEDLKAFEKATAGTVSKGNLIQMSNQLSDMGVNLKRQTILFALAENSADAYGTTVQEGMSKVMMASNGSERALMKLGIALPTYTNNLNELVKASGKKLELMTAEEQETIRLEALMRSTNMTYEEAINKTQSQNDKIEQLTVSYEELQIKLGQVMLAQVEHSGIIDNYNIILGGLNNLFSTQDTVVGDLATTIFERLIPAYGALADIGRAGAWLEKNVSTTNTQIEMIKNAAIQSGMGNYAGIMGLKPDIEKEITSGIGTGKTGEKPKMEYIGSVAKETDVSLGLLDQEIAVRKAEIENIIKNVPKVADPIFDKNLQFREDKKKEADEKELALEKQKWDNIQSIASQGTDIIGDQLYNAMTGGNVNIERAFKQLLARMVADFVSSGILTLLMRAMNPTGAAAQAGIGLFGMLGFAGGVEGLKGAGTETSDSITARLSKGESVLTAGATRAVQQSMGEGWITQLNKQYARSRSNMALGTFAGGIESLPSSGSRVVVTREIGDLYIDSQKVDYAIKTRGSVKNDRRMS
jgi:hypothetical protein